MAGAFPKPQPNSPKILNFVKTPADKKLAIAVLAYGADDLSALAQFTKCPVEDVEQKLKRPEFIAFVNHLRDNPKEVAPAVAEIVAVLTVEMMSGDRSTDRQRAAETLLEITKQKQTEDELESYRNKPGAQSAQRGA